MARARNSQTKFIQVYASPIVLVKNKKTYNKKRKKALEYQVGDLVAVQPRGLLATDHVILNHGQVTWTTPELAPPSPNDRTTPTGERFSSQQF
ncbi:hypothetical protein TNCV_961881 [Trichonephila clavipes]|nr:hypothetical protein TNCV_961881 [Trichonephila clavipes]